MGLMQLQGLEDMSTYVFVFCFFFKCTIDKHKIHLVARLVVC